MVAKIRIGPIDYTVRGNTELSLDEDVAGKLSTNLSRIVVDSNLSPQRSAFVLLHEAIHAILIHGQVDLGEAEESAVDIIAMGVLALIRDNPDVVREIQGVWE